MVKKIAVMSLILLSLGSTASAANICENYSQNIRTFCHSGSKGIRSGSTGACLGASLGAIFHGCW